MTGRAAGAPGTGASAFHHRRHHHQPTGGGGASSSAGSSPSALLRWHDFLLRDAALPHESDAQIRSSPDGPLRWLLLRRPPPRVVRSVIDAHRPAIFFSAAARSANRRGETALHQACALGCSAEMIGMILDEDHAAAGRRTVLDGETPLHLVRDSAEATAALLRAHPRGIAARDQCGGIPLHAAALRDSSAGPTRLLLAAGRETTEELIGPDGGALDETHRGVTPLSLACAYFASSGTGTGEEFGGEESTGRWEKTEALAEAALDALEDDDDDDDLAAVTESSADVLDNDENKESRDESSCSVEEPQPFRILHALLELGCPSPVVLRAVRTFPEQISQRDALGRLPLHLACGGGRRRRPRRRFSNPGKHNFERSEANTAAPTVASPAVIRALLDPDNGGYPRAASVVDSKGRLPLHILSTRDHGKECLRAEEGGIRLTAGFLDEEDDATSDTVGALSLVFRAAPRAIEMRDASTTGMSLFMLAAVGGSTGRGKEDEEDTCKHDDGRLDLVYCLLRKAPAVLLRYSSPSRYSREEVLR